MNIAIFHNHHPGGGKRSAYEWVKRMAKDHTVDLYLYDLSAEQFLDLRPYVRRTILVSGGEKKGGKWLGRLSWLFRTMRASKVVAKKINAGGYDLAFIMQCKAWNSPFVLRYLRIPSLYFCHEPVIKGLEAHSLVNRGSLAPLKKIFMQWLARYDRINARYATLICANSLYSCENIYRFFGVYPRLNYCGVDPQQFRPLNIERCRVVLSVGSLIPNKAAELIIQSIGTLQERSAVRFISYYSDKDYENQLVQLAKRVGVSISIDNLATEDDLVMAYNQAMVTAFPSKMEPFGLVSLESMACGTPVVGIAEGGIRETIQHGKTGLLTERDPVEFGKAIEILLKDESLRTRMGATGRQHVVQHWTWDQSYQKLEKYMYLILSQHSAV